MQYRIQAGFYNGDECFVDDSREVVAESLEEALHAFHNTWFPDMKYEYSESWEAYCYAEEPTCWKSICLEDEAGEALKEIEVREGDETSLYDIEQEMLAFEEQI